VRGTGRPREGPGPGGVGGRPPDRPDRSAGWRARPQGRRPRPADSFPAGRFDARRGGSGRACESAGCVWHGYDRRGAGAAWSGSSRKF